MVGGGWGGGGGVAESERRVGGRGLERGAYRRYCRLDKGGGKLCGWKGGSVRGNDVGWRGV